MMKVKPYAEADGGEQAVLTKELAEASKAYYSGGIALMSDAEFDEKAERLRKLEEESGFAYDASPTVKVGAEGSKTLEKSEHEHPALSLDKVKYRDRESLKKWLGKRKGLLSWKMDGLTIVATYDGGRLTKAVTRGDGRIGSVVTRNASRFEGLPQEIPYKGHAVIRGEGVMTNKEFERVNAEAGGIYENARNLASATIQMPDFEESAKRGISFRAFKLVVPTPDSDEIPNAGDEGSRFAWMASQGIGVTESAEVSAENVLETIEEWKGRIPNNEAPTDGLVLSYLDAEYAESLGSTGHHPRGSIALKWSDEAVRTTVRAIEWSAGRTGALTPVAVFDEVRLGLGSNVTRASLHNVSVMRGIPSFDGKRGAGCGVGSEADVYMANMIIPQIRACSPGRIEIPDRCPSCGGKTELRSRNGVETLFCPNPECPAKKIRKAAAFVSKEGVNIEGLSEGRVEYLLSNGYVRSGVDFYRLKDRPELTEKLSKADGWGEKSVRNLLENVERSRKITLKRFLYALSIPLLGRDLSTKLEEYFEGDPDKFLSFVRNPDEDALARVDGIGPVKAGNLADWCRERIGDERLMDELTSLMDELEFEKPAEKAEASLKGLTFVVTGSLNSYANRDEFKASVEARGGKTSGSVSSKTSFLVNNDVSSTSGKNRKAKELGVPIISEAEFIERFGR